MGPVPWRAWSSAHPDPTLGELLTRYRNVWSWVEYYRVQGWEPPKAWLYELGVI